MKVLATGSAGFIGSAVAAHLLKRGNEVVGVDNLNDYYDITLKQARLARLEAFPSYRHVCLDIADAPGVRRIFAEHLPQRVINLAAQAGVRYAAINPDPYVTSNVVGFLNILEGCRHAGVDHLVFASTSSVYGADTAMPFSEHQGTDHPLTLYAATKKANELMAHSYAHLYSLPCTGLRFFTVYGPWGRPDMALFLFADAIMNDRPIQLFNKGHHARSFTYIDDIVEGVVRILDLPAVGNPHWNSRHPDPATSASPYRILNIGSAAQVELLHYVEVLESCLGKTARRDLLPLQPGDVPDTQADVSELFKLVGYSPKVNVETGVRIFVDWYRTYFGV